MTALSAPVQDPPKSLTTRQMRFVDGVVAGKSARAAAIDAGYRQNSAGEMGSMNLKKPHIATLIAERRHEVAKRTDMDAEWVLKRLRKNVNRSMQAEPVRDRDGEETGEYRYEGAVANKGLELIGRHLGMFAEKQTGSGLTVVLDLGGLVGAALVNGRADV